MLTRMPRSLLNTILRVEKSQILTLDGFKKALNQELDLLVSEGVIQEPIPKKNHFVLRNFMKRDSPVQNWSIADNFHVGSQSGPMNKTPQKYSPRKNTNYRPT